MFGEPEERVANKTERQGPPLHVDHQRRRSARGITTTTSMIFHSSLAIARGRGWNRGTQVSEPRTGNGPRKLESEAKLHFRLVSVVH